MALKNNLSQGLVRIGKPGASGSSGKTRELSHNGAEAMRPSRHALRRHPRSQAVRQSTPAKSRKRGMDYISVSHNPSVALMGRIGITQRRYQFDFCAAFSSWALFKFPSNVLHASPHVSQSTPALFLIARSQAPAIIFNLENEDNGGGLAAGDEKKGRSGLRNM